MLFAATSNTKVTQDQSLELQSKIIAYVREALVYDNGYLVFEVKDLSSFEFDFYYSSGSEIKVLYEETRDESLDRILFVINCKDFHKTTNNDDLNVIMVYLYNYVVGFISANILYDKYKVKDYSHIFKDTKGEQIE